jgi:hypothetical protein
VRQFVILAIAAGRSSAFIDRGGPLHRISSRCVITITITLTLAIAGACASPTAPSLSSSAGELAGTDRLDAGERLNAGQAISSGSTTLVYQGDNNLVL